MSLSCLSFMQKSDSVADTRGKRKSKHADAVPEKVKALSSRNYWMLILGMEILISARELQRRPEALNRTIL